MRILIGGSDVCGMIYDLGEEYKMQGHKVVTVSPGKNRFFNYHYDINPENLGSSFTLYKTGSQILTSILTRLMQIAGRRIENALNSLYIRNLLSQTDCYIHVYNTALWEEERQLKYLKERGKKIITLFVGSDIRDYFLFKEKYKLKHWNFTDEINEPGRKAKEKKLKLHEKYSDAIFSVPDQSMLAKRPYFHLQLPMKVEKFTFNIPAREIPIVLHAPSKSHIKGSDLIIETLTKLQRQGLRFEFRLLENLQHELLLKELTNADILVDELILHGPGFLSFEAMLSGCAVATRYLEDSPDIFKPPVMNIDEDTIEQQLKIILTDKEQRVNLAKLGREYALKNNNIKKVAADILSKLNSIQYDYFPSGN